VTGPELRSETATERCSETATERLSEVTPTEAAATVDLQVNAGELRPTTLAEGRGLLGAWEPEAMAEVVQAGEPRIVSAGCWVQ
jgi:hypothetical protein